MLWPIKWFPCFRLCDSNGTVNKILCSVSVIIDFGLGGILFAFTLTDIGRRSEFVSSLQSSSLFGPNFLQIYLIFINLIAFFGYERSHQDYLEGETTDPDKIDFFVWFLNFLTFIGGSIGMLICLLIHREIPRGYNGEWWSFLYTSLLFWFTIYCYIVNPFAYEIKSISYISAEHIALLVYFVGINIISGLFFYTFRKKQLNEYSLLHTFFILLGMLGGTIGGMLTVIITKRTTTYHYAIIGFPVMLLSQIVFSMYMMSVGVF